MMILIRRAFTRLMNDEPGDTGGTDSGETIGTGNDARVALLNRINDANDSAYAEDLADINDDGTTAPFVPEASSDLEEQSQEPEGEVHAKAPVEEEAPKSQMVTLKINGREELVTLEDALSRAQKVSAADEYLQEAARERAAARAAQHTPEPPKQPTPDPQEEAARIAEDRRALARAIQMGTEEEAVAAIEKLQNMSRAPTLTVEDVGRVADERLKFNSAISWFNREYKDLVKDPQLHRMVLEADAALIRGGDKRPYAERYKEVGDGIRAWRDNLIKSAAPAAAVASLDDKRAAKAAAPKVPTAASAKATQKRDEEEDESPSSIIANMAKARGGPQWARG